MCILWCQINIWMSTYIPLGFHETQLCETWIKQDSVLIFDNIWDCISISKSWCLMWSKLIFIQHTTSRTCNFDVYNSEILSYLSLNWNVSKWVFSSWCFVRCWWYGWLHWFESAVQTGTRLHTLGVIDKSTDGVIVCSKIKHYQTVPITFWQ